MCDGFGTTGLDVLQLPPQRGSNLLGMYMDTIQYGLYKTLGSLDTIKLKQECLSIYETLKQLPMDKSWVGNDGQPNAPTTLKSLSQYNIFTFPTKSLYELYDFVKQSFYEIEKAHYGYNLKQKYYIQAWLNVYQHGQFIDWHGHHYNVNWAWHGFYCVDAEPSETLYKFIDGSEISVPSINNQLCLGICEHNEHKTLAWPYTDRPRITIAFDIVSVQSLKDVQYNHWIPI